MPVDEKSRSGSVTTVVRHHDDQARASARVAVHLALHLLA